MFNSEKKIPKTLKECYAPDRVSGNLWIWSERVESWGIKVLIALIVIGIIAIIMSIIEAASVNYVVDDIMSYMNMDTGGGFDFMSVLMTAVIWAFIVFIEYIAYNVLSLLFASLASIVQNTIVTANIAVYKAAKEEGTLNEEPQKPVSSVQKAPKFMASSGSWICKECGTRNDATNVYCKDCGKYK